MAGMTSWWHSHALIVAIAAAVVAPYHSNGHTAGLSTTDCKFTTNGLDAEVIFAVADLNAALAHRNASKPVDANRDGQMEQSEFNNAIQQLRGYFAESLEVQFDGQRMATPVARLSLDELENFHVQLKFAGNRPGRLRIKFTLFGDLPASHRHFVSVQDTDGKQLGTQMLYPNEYTMEVMVPGEGNVTGEPVSTSFGGFFLLGVKHIWTGYDHMLFLLALLLVCERFKTAVQIVTLFTIAHSITLAFSTLNLVWVAGSVVEPMIAASIIYIGAENLFFSGALKGRSIVTFLFGLIHGFGFASVLKDLGVAATPKGVGVPLIGFNLGVEAGQIVVAAALLPLFWYLRKNEAFLKRGIPACSIAVMAMGAYWLVQRVWF
jgi:hydrogenase/urease accessory protein HupE